MENQNDTIAAITTGLTNSGVGIIRISGEKAIETVQKIFKPANPKKTPETMKGYTAAYGTVSYRGTLYDEAILLIMRAPHTYTREDIAEIQCHGGIMVQKKILDLICQFGVRAAEPGEFTKRAFLNGRIDLSQAESVMDVIRSKNEKALSTSLQQLTGVLGRKIKELREEILHHSAYIESALDDPENYSLETFPERLDKSVDKLLINIETLVSTYHDGQLIRDGIRTIIVGKPNAGKSSVLNLLLGEDRAIVTDIAGTTRDTLEECIHFGDISLNLVDTAGIRETEDLIEKIGIDKAINTINEADLVLFTVDGSTPLTEEDYRIMQLIGGKKSITLINKNDQKIVVDKLLITKEIDTEILEMSALTGNGIELLKNTITRMFFSGAVQKNDELIITRQRHKQLLEEAAAALRGVKQSIADKMSEDFYTIDLMSAYTSLGQIIGAETEDDLAEKIFSEFCMGK